MWRAVRDNRSTLWSKGACIPLLQMHEVRGDIQAEHRMRTHECKTICTCCCSITASEPNEKCPMHGHPWPPRCEICGRFMKWESAASAPLGHPMRYKTAKDGEWIQPGEYSHCIMCCDCGLVHEFRFRVYQGRIQFRAKRLARATAAARRKKRRQQCKTG